MLLLQDPDSAVATPSSTVSSHGSGKKNDGKASQLEQTRHTVIHKMGFGKAHLVRSTWDLNKSYSSLQTEMLVSMTSSFLPIPKVCPCPDDFETQLMEMLEGEVPTEAAGEVMHKDGSRRQAEKEKANQEI